MTGKKLTAKQKRFIEEYATDPNAVQAYFRAFGRLTSKGKRRSYQGASRAAKRLLENDLIRAELGKANDAYSARVRVSKLRVLRELANVAFFDPADAFDPDPAGGPLLARPLHDIPAPARRAIASAKVKRRRIAGGGDEVYEVEEVEYKFAPKLDALDKLCKKLGLFAADDDKPTTSATVPVELVTALLARLGADGSLAGVNALGAEPGAAEPGVPQPGG